MASYFGITKLWYPTNDTDLKTPVQPILTIHDNNTDANVKLDLTLPVIEVVQESSLNTSRPRIVDANSLGAAEARTAYLLRVRDNFSGPEVAQFQSIIENLTFDIESVTQTVTAIAILFKDSSELFQDFSVYLPNGYSLFCPTDVSEVDLWVLTTPQGAQVQWQGGADIPAALPTNLVDLRRAVRSGTNLTELSGSSASVALQLLQLELDRGTLALDEASDYLEVLRRLSDHSSRIPPSIYLHNIRVSGTDALSVHRCAETWQGRTVACEAVCLKVLRHSTDSKRRALEKVYCTQAIIWYQIRCPHILPFYGVYTHEINNEPRLSLVSPWMEHGNLTVYLTNHPDHDRVKAIKEIASGVRYLHDFDPCVVHGSIKGANVLVKPDLTCALSDFGLAYIAKDSGTGALDGLVPDWMKGNVRWMSPELLNPIAFPNLDDSARKASDIYSLSSTALELFTGERPYNDPEHPDDPSVMLDVIRGIKPHRPTDRDVIDRGLSDDLWRVLELMWSYSPQSRPGAKSVCDLLDDPSLMISPPTTSQTDSALSSSLAPPITLSRTRSSSSVSSSAAPVFAKANARRKMRW